MKLLGIDYGEKKIGLAIGEKGVGLAVPYKSILNQSPSQVLKELKKIIKEEEIKKIVVGVPLALKEGEESPFLRKVESFINYLKRKLPQKIEKEDERFTTKEIKKVSQRYRKIRIDIDAASATLILQKFLDKNKVIK